MRPPADRLLALLLFLVGLAACGGDKATPPSEVLQARIDYGPVGSLAIGDTARPRLYDASSHEVFATAWSSSDPSIASVGITGLVTGVRKGSATIRLSAAGGSASVQVVVGGTLHTGAIRASESWTVDNGPHVVDSLITVGASGGATLTVGPGVSVYFKKPGAALAFGEGGSGTLIADGSAAPIVFRAWSDTAAEGTWRGLRFHGAGRSVLKNVTLRACGRTSEEPSGVNGPPSSGCILLLNQVIEPDAPELLLDDVRVIDGKNAAIVLEGMSRLSDGSRLLTVQSMRGFVGKLRAGLVGLFPVGGTFSDIDVNELQVSEDTLATSAEWPNQGFAYHILGPVVIQGSATPELNIGGGAAMTFDRFAAFVVGRDAPGSLRIGATTGQRVQMKPDADGWVGVQFWSKSVNSSISNATLHACGIYVLPVFGNGCIQFIGNSATPGPSPVLSDVTIDSAGYAAVNATRGGRFGAASDNLTITRTLGVPIQADIDVLPTIPSGTYTGNVIDQVRVIGSLVSTSMTLRNLGIAYGIPTGLTVEGVGNPILTIESGTALQMGVGSYLGVGVFAAGGIRAVGTSSSPIHFFARGPNEHPGWWMRVQLGTLADPSSLLDHVLIEHAGGEDRGAAGIEFLRDLGPIFRNSTVRLSAGCGVLRSGAPWTTDFTAPSLGNRFEQLADSAQCGPR